MASPVMALAAAHQAICLSAAASGLRATRRAGEGTVTATVSASEGAGRTLRRSAAKVAATRAASGCNPPGPAQYPSPCGGARACCYRDW